MTAAPLLGAWLARAMPGLAARDLGSPPGRMLPWLPAVRLGLAAPAALPPAERALLAGFRQAGRPLLGLDPVADGLADAAWDAAPERLVWRDASGPPGEECLTLLQGGLGEAATPAGQARILLLLGSQDRLERHDLLVPEARLADLFARLRAAAAEIAGPGWQVGGRLVSPRLGSLTALAPRLPEPRLALDPAGLPHDLPNATAAGALALEATVRLRLLLGVLPARAWQLRLGFAGAGPGPVALFVEGLRQPTRQEAGGWLTASVTPPADRALVLGLAWPGGAPAGLRLDRLEGRA